MVADLLLLLVSLLPLAIIGFLMVIALRRSDRHELLKSILIVAIFGVLFLLLRISLDRWGYFPP